MKVKVKKLVISGVFALAVISLAAYEINNRINEQDLMLSNLMLDNVDALAKNEGGCWGTTDWKLIWSDEYQRNLCKKGGEACCL